MFGGSVQGTGALGTINRDKSLLRNIIGHLLSSQVMLICGDNSQNGENLILLIKVIFVVRISQYFGMSPRRQGGDG